MPDVKPGESEKEYVGRCIPIVLNEGTTKDSSQAAAICHSKWREAHKNWMTYEEVKALCPACAERMKAAGLDRISPDALKQDDNVTVTPVVDAEAVKVGARHSHKDQEALQSIHDGAVALGALCPQKAEVTYTPIVGKAIEPIDPETLVSFGTEIKMLDNGHLGGYLVRFTDETTPDITGDFFTKQTDFGSALNAPVYFNHCQPIKNKDGREFGIASQIGECTITPDDTGLFVDAILYNRDEYEKAISKYYSKMGWSSGTAPHLVQREQKGNAQWIKRWPIGLDASITPTPAEPRNKVISLKSLSALAISGTDLPNSAAEAVDTAPQAGQEGTQVINQQQEEIKMSETLDIKAIVAEASKNAAEEAIKAYTASLPSLVNAGVQVTRAESDQPFETPGKFFMAVKNAALYPSQIDTRLMGLKATGANENIPSQGGFLLPQQMQAGIQQNMYSIGTILGLVKRFQVEGNGMSWNFVDETSRADGSRYGGIASYWLAEAGTITSSKAKFRQLNLVLKKVAALCYATDEMLEDGTAIGSWLGQTVPDELRFAVEDRIVTGNGVGSPAGLLTSGALKSATRTDAGEIDVADIARMWAGRFPGFNDYVWLINPTCVPQLVQLSIGNVPVWVTSVVGAPYPATIFGRPVYETEYNPALGTLGDILLFSPSAYYLIEKAGGVQAASSIHVNFTSAETAFRFIYRVDGAPTWYTTLTGNDSQTYSPYVALAATT